ncbi:MAG TPA: hypothetical protein VH914_18810 [Acidimicrobiia bacterium]|nr:hypothetical protein [Acidimicrobiia bacterium]
MITEADRQSSRPADRLRLAWQRRHETDYILRFPSALGWFVITGGGYGFYVLYQLLRRGHAHNRRRIELLDAATELAWDQARARGLNEELRPHFERIAERARALQELNAEFRDPALWVVLAAATLGLAQLAAWTAVDGDLARHDDAERAIEIELAAIYSRMGAYLAAPNASASTPRHRARRRIAATIATAGLYAIWWVRDLMREGNDHFRDNWRFEDDLANASRSMLQL